MTTRLRFLAIGLCAAGLTFGPALRAQNSTIQSESVSYALTLIDAGEDGSGNSATGGPVTADTTHVRVKVTVSIPRDPASHAYTIPTGARPVRLMYRRHLGIATAFDGSIALAADAPYSDAAGTPMTTACYPMPQATTVTSPAGRDVAVSQTDPTRLNYFGVRPRSAQNANGQTYADYTAPGRTVDPIRWECTFLSPAYAIADIEADTTGEYAMLRALLDGEGTYEWYAASRYGLGSFARVSDIQDHGRKMTFTDVRLWTPVTDAELTAQWAGYVADADSIRSLGPNYCNTLASMPDRGGIHGTWAVYGGAVGDASSGRGGLQLLNVIGSDDALYSDFPRVESPFYPDGISAVTFQASVPGSDPEGTPQTLVVQVSPDGGTNWSTVETLTLSSGFEDYTVAFGDAAPSGGAGTRFRIVRTSHSAGEGQANLGTVAIRNLLVRSAAPKADFGQPRCVSATQSAEPYATEPFEILFNAQGDGVEQPRGYEGAIRLRRRAEGDTTRVWREANVAIAASSGNATLSAAFTPGTLLLNPDGSVNAAENAFFLDTDGKVTGMLPGVYDIALDYAILGSFEAGREDIDAHERVSGTLATHPVTVHDDETGLDATVQKPNLLDLREHQALDESAFLRVTYRSGRGTDLNPYTFHTLDLPLLPASRGPHRWRADVARILRLADDEQAVYAWGYDPTPEDGGAGGDETIREGYLAFKVCVVDANGDARWYGQTGAATAGVLPPTIEAVPAVTDLLAAAASEADAVPVTVPLDTLPNSHITIELDLSSVTTPGYSLCGSYWQDFNTWYATSDRFSDTEFREDVRSRVADFDCDVLVNDDGSARVSGGWIPDEGPLADTTSFLETFPVGRGDNQRGEYPFFMEDGTYIARSFFRQWGASGERAYSRYLREGENETTNYSTYVQFAQGTEVVLRRSWQRLADGTYVPDAQVRLRGEGDGIRPRDDGAREVTLNGVGTVSFKLGLSLPYDINKVVYIVPEDESLPLMGYAGYGVAAGVQIDNPSRNCAASGYSVSYYLRSSDRGSARIYELRVTQIVDFNVAGDSNDRAPANVCVAEIYRWQNGSATRLSITDTNGTALDQNYYSVDGNLGGKSFAFWVQADGRLAAGFASSVSGTSFSAAFRTAETELAGSDRLMVGFGSAECRPTFRFASRMEAMNAAYTASPISPDAVTALEATPPSWANGSSWTLSADTQNTAYLRLVRKTPSAEAAGQVRIWAERDDGSGMEDSPRVSTAQTDTTVEVTVGVANAKLHIAAANPESNVFIDDISVTSWCGNDANRNGNDRVPTYTDVGFTEASGFAGVGLWIRPVDENQLDVAGRDYRGEQCVLLQRSRQNTAEGLSGEIGLTGGDYFITGSSLALVSPHSAPDASGNGGGFGAVSFRYRIPSQDEYGDQGVLPSVYVMLQFLSDSRTNNNWLSEPGTGWVDVSDPIELHNTAGEWSTASITPRLEDGSELVGTSGYLRLVMAIPAEYVNDRDYDPYVYIDDYTVTDNRTGSIASWSAKGVLLTDEPISWLYWKDRAATATANPAEETFAEKSSLTRALQLNDATDADDAEVNQDSCHLNAPPLENGIGRLTFAARLTEPQANPVRLYVFASESEEEDLEDFRALTYVEVTNTVYNVFDIDLSKFTRYTQKPNADLSPDLSTGTDAFNASDIRRIRILTYLDGDGTSTDAFGNLVTHGRVMIDRLSVCDPVQPSLRVESVAFSNVAGQNDSREFDASSPLSQPVADAPVLRTMVTLGRQQLLREETIRVFFTYDMNAVGGGNVVRNVAPGSYSYTDVLGGTVSASNSLPVYAWSTSNLDAWPLSAWFDLEAARDAVLGASASGTLTQEELAALGVGNTIELTRGDSANQAQFFGDLSRTGLTGLAPNSLVRYTAWAVYQSSESDQWFATQISPSTYTEFPWYFPRNLNAEIRAHKNATLGEGEEQVGAAFFSPYYWVYSCIPGEAFINEFNFNDPGSANPSLRNFVEICAPAELNISEWRFVTTERDSTSVAGTVVIPATADGSAVSGGVGLPLPDPGVVPARRGEAGDGTSANRSFYTLYDSACNLFYRENGERRTDRKPYKNAGLAAAYEHYAIASSGAAALQLIRPTGGAEHIVIYSPGTSGSVGGYQDEIERLHQTYQNAYVTGGFGSEWYQAFLDTTWEQETQTYNDANISARDHARRLAVADVYMGDANGRYSTTGTTENYVFDYDNNTDFANSIATVDMGGKWVTRRNDVAGTADGGPADLTHILVGDWDPSHNLTVDTRFPEPTEDLADNAVRPVVQVTPRQVNPGQYLVPYSGLSQCAVTSTIQGGLGQHYLEELTDGNVTRTRRAGRNSPTSWSLDSAGQPTARLNYAALPFSVVSAVSVRLRNPEGDGSYITDADTLAAQFPGATLAAADADGWAVVTVPADATAFALEVRLYPVDDPTADLRYSAEARVTFSLKAENARDIITRVAPFTGTSLGGSAAEQPWWGSGFGFAVDYDAAALPEGASLSSVLILYPDAGQIAAPDAMAGLAAGWTGNAFTYTPAATTPGETPDPVTVALEGMEYAAATNALDTVLGPEAGTRYVALRSGADGRLSDPSLVGILSDAYARAAGYDGTAGTATKKEPAIPYIAWGVYSVNVPADNGSETVSFLLRQALPGELPGVFDYPTWYAPLADLNADKPAEATIPYFYLYSTPPQAAWLSEVNLAQANGSEPYVEAVLPNLRQGILDAGVPAVDGIGWSVRCYEQTGASMFATSLPATRTAESGSTAYHYYTATITQNLSTLSAYVLHRPCGAGEGGVWTGVDAVGDTSVAAPASLTENGWLLDATSYVVPGVTDSDTTAGSVQLVGQLIYDDASPTLGRIPSDVSMRTQWSFAPESRDADNEGLRPDLRPEWNQVTVTSAIRNIAFGTGTCGYQVVPGFFADASVTGVTTNVTHSLSGGEWVYAQDRANVLSYRPRTGYCFDSITLPPDLIGHVMLIGGSGGFLTQATVTSEWQRLTALEQAATDAAAKQAIRLGDWLTLGGRASLETRRVTNADGTITEEPTGVIRFNPDFFEGNDEVFADRDDFVVTLVFVDEPSSAQNAVTVAFTQGNVGAGAWLVTQTLYALDAAGAPDAEKGGEAVDTPIWSDEAGNAAGEHQNVHGWLYQPTVGDTLGMAAVIDPELGLVGGQNLGTTLENVYGALSSANATARPFLVWTLIPKSKVPETLFDETNTSTATLTRTEFLNWWQLNQWVSAGGILPSIREGQTIDLRTLRETLQNNVNLAQGASGSKVAYNAAGIIPMTLQGYCGPGQALTAAPEGTPPADYGESLLLSYRTMTQAELDDALANGRFGLANTEGLLPYTAAIPMTDRALWQDGAVLRFAIIIADPTDGRVFDCQGLSNFTSEGSTIYCPWYVPNADSNINVVSSNEGRGASPYAWVYGVARDGVWLNEIRPFRNADAGVGAVPSAVELAMQAAYLDDGSGNYVHPSEIARTDNRFLPRESLDGWRIVTKYAPLPLSNASVDTPIQWQEHRTIDLVGWVPYRRIRPTTSSTDPAFYDLDYYVVTTSVDQGFANDPNTGFRDHPYDGSDSARDTFTWLRAPQELFDPALPAQLAANADYASGALYAVTLVRNNGVVADEVLFHANGKNINNIPARMALAVAIENASGTVANTVRCFSGDSITAFSPNAALQFVEQIATGYRAWVVDASAGNATNTFPGPNIWDAYTQPHGNYAPILASTFSVTAQLLGGDGELSLAIGNAATARGPSVTATGSPGEAYTLAVAKPWNPAWYTLQGITKNGRPFTPQVSRTVRYALNAGTLAATDGATIETSPLDGDTDYVLTLVYTPDAARLLADGALESADEGFLDWVRERDPSAILAQSAADGVTASEKYWLGFDAADYDATDVALRITEFTFYRDAEDAPERPAIAIELVDGATPIDRIQGDGALVLLGKESLDDPEWRFIRRLQPEDFNQGRLLLPDTDCRFFRAVLLSERQTREAELGQ